MEFSRYTAVIYPDELNLNKSNMKCYNCPLVDLDISFLNGKFYTKMYYKMDYFSYLLLRFSFFDGTVHFAASYNVYLSQLVRFAHVYVTLWIL